MKDNIIVHRLEKYTNPDKTHCVTTKKRNQFDTGSPYNGISPFDKSTSL